MGACHESMQTTIGHEHAVYTTAPWFTAVNIIVVTQLVQFSGFVFGF
jgi:hypothetical protein